MRVGRARAGVRQAPPELAGRPGLSVGPDGSLLSLPVEWTDVVAEDPFVVVAAGRTPFHTAGLLELAELVDRMRVACERPYLCCRGYCRHGRSWLRSNPTYLICQRRSIFGNEACMAGKAGLSSLTRSTAVRCGAAWHPCGRYWCRDGSYSGSLSCSTAVLWRAMPSWRPRHWVRVESRRSLSIATAGALFVGIGIVSAVACGRRSEISTVGVAERENVSVSRR